MRLDLGYLGYLGSGQMKSGIPYRHAERKYPGDIPLRNDNYFNISYLRKYYHR